MTTESTIPARATRREWIGLGVITLAALVYSMDLTVLNLAIPRISAELQPSSVELLWMIDIYGFLVAGLLITMGTLGDRIGRRRLLLGGAAGFALASLLAAFSTSPQMLIASRAIMGIAGATVAPSTLSLIFTMFLDPKQRSTAIGVWIAAYSAGGAIGPVLGGILLEFFWWGSVFLIGVPVMALLLVLGPRTLPEYRDPNARRLDLLSAAMSLVAILGLVFGLKQIAQDGVSAPPIAAILAGVVIGWVFVRRQLQIESPMIDVRLFRIRAFSASLASYLLGIFVVVGYFLFIAQYLQLVLGLSPLEAALWSLPSAAGFIVGSTVAPRIIHRVAPKVVMGTGMLIAAGGTLLLAFLPLSGAGGLVLIAAASVIISIGLAPVITLATELIVGSAPPEQAGAATGMSETGGELGGALGIAILGSIGTAVYRAEVADRIPPDVPAAAADAARDTLGGALAIAETLPAEIGAALVAVAQVAFLDALHFVAVVSAIGAVLTAIIAVVALWRVPKREEPATVEADAEADAEAALAAAAGAD
ncbi:MAG TPA: MFS transporter [Candidatus Limnocylindria bacterium]|nr:MFS transporter [Candidatus Limnocylindria bacterium]